MKASHLQAIGEPYLELILKLDLPTLVDFHKLLERCSRTPSQYHTYQIGKCVIEISSVGASVYLFQKSIQRLPCRIRPESYGIVLPHLEGILQGIHHLPGNWLLIQEYLRGLSDAQGFQDTEHVGMESAQSRG